jgi:hypothetical protein
MCKLKITPKEMKVVQAGEENQYNRNTSLDVNRTVALTQHERKYVSRSLQV